MKYKSLILLLALALPVRVTALNVGFEAQVRGEVSDNVNQNNRGEEIQGNTASGLVSVFGDHRTQKIEFGFTGELSVFKQYDEFDSSDEVLNLTRFYGSLEAALSRSVSWYFGDVLGGSRRSGTVGLDDQDLLANRRNVFITGPTLDLELGAGRSMDASLFYINNSDDSDNELATLYSLNTGFYTPLGAGLRGGFRLGNVAVDNSRVEGEPDYERLSTSIFVERTRSLDAMLGGIGFTRYQSDGYDLNGASAELRWTRTLNEGSGAYVSLTRQLTDESLNSINTLTQTGDAAVEDARGIFASTVFEVGYKRASGPSGWGISLGADDTDYAAVLNAGEFNEDASDTLDEIRYYGGLNYNTSFSARWNLTLFGNISQEQNRTTEDFNNSAYAGAESTYKFGRSFEFVFTLEHEINETMTTSSAGLQLREDTVENRALATIRYVPLTRVDNTLVVKLKSLVY